MFRSSKPTSSVPAEDLLGFPLPNEKKFQQYYGEVVSVYSTLQKEKRYTDETLQCAIRLYLGGLDGSSGAEKLEAFNNASHRTTGVRRLAIKALLMTAFQEHPDFRLVSISSWSREIFARLEIRDNENLSDVGRKFLRDLCHAVCASLATGQTMDEELFIALSKKDFFQPSWFSVMELNRSSVGSLPDEQELKEKLLKAAHIVRQNRKESIDLEKVLDIFGTAPHRFTRLIPVLMRPQLQRMQHPTVMACLDKTLVFIGDNLDWDYETMPAAVANIQRHPGIPLASEVAKSLSFGELYDILIRVINKLILGEGRGFDKCQLKLKYRLGLMSEEQLRKVVRGRSATVAELVSDGRSGRDAIGGAPQAPVGKVAMAGKSPRQNPKEEPDVEPVSVREFREMFGLVPEIYDRHGNNLPQLSEKNRAHSYIAGAIMVPFLKGLYEARADHLDMSMEIDSIFIATVQEVRLQRGASRSLDEKKAYRKRISAIQRVHSKIVSIMETSRDANVSWKQCRMEMEMSLESLRDIGLDVAVVLSKAESDFSKLKKNTKCKPNEARVLLKMSKEGPEDAENIPPSPWTDFFKKNLKAMSKVLKAAGAVIQLDMISSHVESHLVNYIADSLPIKPDSKKVLVKDENFRTVVKVSWENTKGRMAADINDRLVRLLKDVYFYTRAKPKAPSPDALCLQLLALTRPFVQEYFRCLQEVDGQELYLALTGLTEGGPSRARFNV